MRLHNEPNLSEDLNALELELAPGLSRMRDAAHNYAAHMQGAPVRRHISVNRPWYLAWAALALACALAGVAVLPSFHDGRASNSAPLQARTAPTDEALLESVQSDLNTDTPSAMSPLRVTGSTSTTSSASRRNR